MTQKINCGLIFKSSRSFSGLCTLRTLRLTLRTLGWTYAGVHWCTRVRWVLHCIRWGGRTLAYAYAGSNAAYAGPCTSVQRTYTGLQVDLHPSILKVTHPAYVRCVRCVRCVRYRIRWPVHRGHHTALMLPHQQ